LNAELDVLLVRKLGVPDHPELAMGALAWGGSMVLNHVAIERLGIDERQIREVVERETVELERRARLYRGVAPPPDIAGRTVLVVDDGLATGSTVRAALEALRPRAPALLVVAVPVAPASAVEALRPAADRIVCLATPEPFFAVGLWYRDFEQVTDDQVSALLARARNEPTSQQEKACKSRLEELEPRR
jgi:predicted phosphoribosyltransferase